MSFCHVSKNFGVSFLNLLAIARVRRIFVRAQVNKVKKQKLTKR